MMADLARLRTSCSVNIAPLAMRAVEDLRIIRRFAHHLRVPVLAVGEDLRAVAHFRADGEHMRQLGDRLGVIHGQRRRAAPAAAHAAAGEIAGKNRDHVFAQAGDLILDLLGRARCRG